MKDFVGLKRSYYMDPQPLRIVFFLKKMVQKCIVKGCTNAILMYLDIYTLLQEKGVKDHLSKFYNC
jgi:hypothetical protein